MTLNPAATAAGFFVAIHAAPNRLELTVHSIYINAYINAVKGHPMKTELYHEIGIGTRLRRLLERLTAEADHLYEDAGLPIRVRHFHVLYALECCGPLTIVDIAERAGFSHSAVSQTVKKLVEMGFLALNPTDDARQKQVSFTPGGHALMERVRPIWRQWDSANKAMLSEGQHDLLAALGELEDALDRKNLKTRFAEVGTDSPIEILPYDVRYAAAFKTLNLRWLEAYFEIEPVDLKALDDPEGYILSGGGEILFAVQDGRAIGVAALKHDGDGVFEFTKFAVDPEVQSKGVGSKLIQAAIDRFQARSGRRLYLETNTKLKAARLLYDRFNWVEKEPARQSPYARCNCYMEWQKDAQSATAA